MLLVIDQLNRYLAGDDNVSAGVKSWARLHIYKQAREIVLLNNPARQREAIEKAPDNIRELLRKECRRYFDMHYKQRGVNE
jgi:hypothetical protein